MLITESKIRQIIAEELETILEEEQLDEVDSKKTRRPLRSMAATAGIVAALGGAFGAGERSATPGFGGRSAESGITSYSPAGEKGADMGGGKRVKPTKGEKPTRRTAGITKTEVSPEVKDTMEKIENSSIKPDTKTLLQKILKYNTKENKPVVDNALLQANRSSKGREDESLIIALTEKMQISKQGFGGLTLTPQLRQEIETLAKRYGIEIFK